MIIEKLSQDIADEHGLEVSMNSTRIRIVPTSNPASEVMGWEFESKEYAETWLHGWQACSQAKKPKEVLKTLDNFHSVFKEKLETDLNYSKQSKEARKVIDYCISYGFRSLHLFDMEPPTEEQLFLFSSARSGVIFTEKK